MYPYTDFPEGTTVISRSPAPNVTQTPGPPVNYTDLGPIGPAEGFLYEPYHTNASVCSGNLFSLWLLCCQAVGGVINTSTVECRAFCCSNFANDPKFNNCTSTGLINYPFCLVSPNATSDWEVCFNLSEKQVLRGLNTSLRSIQGCRPPTRMGNAPHSVSTAAVIVLIASLVSAVFAAA